MVHRFAALRLVLRALALLALFELTLEHGDGVHAQPRRAEAGNLPCLGVLRFRGPPATVAALRRQLAAGPLAATPGATCTGGTVTIRESDAGFEFRYAQGDRAATHRVASLAQASAWLESWLLPLAGPAPELQAAPAEPPSSPTPPAPATVATATHAAPAPIPLYLGGGLRLSSGPAQGLALGLELFGSVRVTPRGVLGIALGGHASLLDDPRERGALDASLRGGWTSRPQGRRPRVELGGGVGLALAWTREESANATGAGSGDVDPDDADDPDETDDPEDPDEADELDPDELPAAGGETTEPRIVGNGRGETELELSPFVEAYARAAFRLGGSRRLDVGLNARATFAGGGPRASLGATLGLAWTGAGWR
ncbi:MAG: hypothetical protein AAGH15_15745 [Myxococcota bacterium]